MAAKITIKLRKVTQIAGGHSHQVIIDDPEYYEVRLCFNNEFSAKAVYNALKGETFSIIVSD